METIEALIHRRSCRKYSDPAIAPSRQKSSHALSRQASTRPAAWDASR